MKIKVFYMAAFAALLAAGCSDNKEKTGGGGNAAQLEEYAMTDEWINYATAVSSELLDDCITLWASWAGPSAVTDARDIARLDNSIFGQSSVGASGYGNLMKSPEGTVLESELETVKMIMLDGFANISNEVGAAKIGDPNALAKAGKASEAVLQVESWYSWNSITDYSDNIISIMNGYAGRRGAITAAAHANSISAYVKSKNPALDDDVLAAIRNAYSNIQLMQAPFRSNLTGSKVDAAIEACADLTELIEGSLIAEFRDAGSDDFSAILAQYVDEVVVPTYKDMKDRAWDLHNAMLAFNADRTNQSRLDAACVAWRAVRVPWEQSEAVLFGPAGDETGLGLDPSLDSWPLDQEEIATMLMDSRYNTVEDYIGAIGSESVRGFHTIELLLFKDGANRTVRTE